jgi:hypothetical protein
VPTTHGWRSDLGVWWLTLAIWLAYVVLAVWNGFLLSRYRREGLLPVKSVRRDLDVLFGRYDHLPQLRAMRRTGMALLAALFVSGAIAMARA